MCVLHTTSLFVSLIGFCASELTLKARITIPLPNAGIRAQPGQDKVETESAKTWVGKKAKGFTLPGTDGKSVDVAKKLGKHPIVLVFYRGVW